ncbi:hypothetical protein BS50DRAFT_195866, partial [Corynespora cassiicola Philippines]
MYSVYPTYFHGSIGGSTAWLYSPLIFISRVISMVVLPILAASLAAALVSSTVLKVCCAIAADWWTVSAVFFISFRISLRAYATSCSFGFGLRHFQHAAYGVKVGRMSCFKDEGCCAVNNGITLFAHLPLLRLNCVADREMMLYHFRIMACTIPGLQRWRDRSAHRLRLSVTNCIRVFEASGRLHAFTSERAIQSYQCSG